MRIGSLVAKGVATFEVGSAGSPSITFSGSTAAGLWAPSPGQVAISTGNTGTNVFELEGGATPGKLTLTTGYDSLIPAAGVAGDDQAAVTKKWVEDNFVIGDITTLGLNDLSDVDITQNGGPNTGDYLAYTGAQWENRSEAEVKADLNLEIGTDIQAQNDQLQNIADAGAPADNEFLVGNASGDWAIEDAAAARTSLGLDSGGAGDIWVDTAGDTMTGNLVLSGAGTHVTLPNSPVAGTDAANKAYVDAAVTGLNWLDPVYYIDFIGDSYGVDVTKDLQTPANDTDSNITSVEDSDMIIIGVGPNSQGLTWTAVGVTGNTTTTTGLKSGDVIRWNSDASNGFLNPSWEKVQLDDGGNHISATIFASEQRLGTNAQQARWGNGIVTNATKRGSMFGFDASILQLVVDDVNGNADKVIITNLVNGNVTDTADGATATGFGFSTTQQGTGSLPEISEVTALGASGLPTSGTAGYFTFDSTTTTYYVWYSVAGGTMADPAVGGRTGIQVDVEPSDDAKAVAQKTASAIAQTAFNAGTARINNEYDAWWGISSDFGLVETNTVGVEAQTNISDGDYFYLYGALQAPQEVAKIVITNNSNVAAADTVDGAVPTNFRFTKLVDGSGSTAEQTQIENACTLSLPLTGPAAYFDFNDGTTTYRVWYNVDSGSTTAPAAGGNTLVPVAVLSSFCAASVAQATLAAINGSAANATATSTASFMDGTNASDGGLRFHVWFDQTGTAVDPAPIDSFGGIKVDVSGDTTADDVAASVKAAVDAYYAQIAGSQIGESAMWEVSVNAGPASVTFTSRHSGRATAAANGSGATGGAWTYSRDQQGTYTGPSNNDAFFVSNPDSFNAGNQYVYSTTSGSWIQFGGATTILPGVGLSQSGQFFNVNLGPGLHENPSDEVSLEFWDTTNDALILTTDGTSRDFANVNSRLRLLLDTTGTGDLVQSSAGLKVAANGITGTEIDTSAAGAGLTGGGGSALAVDAGDGLTTGGGDLDIDATSTFSFPGGQLEIAAGQVTASMLADDYVDVSGDTMTGDLTMDTGAQILMDGSGTAGAPAVAVSGDPDTGLYSVGTNQLGISTNGTLRATFNTTDLTMAVPVLNTDGGVGAPSVSFADDTDTGMWSSADDFIDFSTGGANRFTIADDGLMTTGGTGAAAYAALITAGGGNTIPNKQWVSDQLSALSTTTIVDGDGDTKVSVEEAADDDTIRMDAGETPAGYGAVADIFVLNSAGWTVAMGTANTAATVGAPISMTAGTGNTSGAGGAVTINAGPGGASGAGGTVTINSGAGYSGTDGGDVNINAGSATSSGYPGDLEFRAGNGGDYGGNAKLYAGNGNDAGGYVSIKAGGGISGDGGNVEIKSGEGTNGDGGEINITAGVANTSGDGGPINIRTGKGAATNAEQGGDITIEAARDGANSANGAYAFLEGGGADGAGFGGDLEMRGGSAPTQGGRVNIDSGSVSSNLGANFRMDGATTSAGGVMSLSGGTDTDGIGGDIRLFPGRGSNDANKGNVEIISPSSSQSAELRISKTIGGNYIGFTIDTGITADAMYTLPALPAGNGYALVSTTAGVMSWLDLGTGLDNSKITDGDAGTAETYIDTDEAADTITSQIGAATNRDAFEPLNASHGAGGTVIRSSSGTGGDLGGRLLSIAAGSADGAGTGGSVNVAAGAGGATGAGGNVTISGGYGNSGAGGDITLQAGNHSSSQPQAGDVLIYGGVEVGEQSSPYIKLIVGNVDIEASSGLSGDTSGDNVGIKSGDAFGNGNAGDITLEAGTAPGSGDGGNLVLKAGDSTSGTLGHIEFDTDDTAAAVETRWQEASTNGTDYIGLKAPNGVTTSRTWVLPQDAPALGQVLTTDGSGNMSFTDMGTLASSYINFGELADITDTTPQTDELVSVLVGDGTNKETQQLVGGTNLTAVVDQGADTVTLNVDDAFISNNGGDVFGDTTPGTWTVASGSTLSIATGGTLTIVDAPTAGTDAVNKTYADSISAGLDPKESVLVATTADLTGVTWGSPSYNYTAGSGGTGAFVDINLSSAVDGVTLAINDRVLVKDQTNQRQNGIYVVKTGNSFPTQALLERAEDHDGSPTNEVSGGNFTFVEDGTAQDTGWVLTGQGTLTLSTNGADGDNIIWTQFTGAGSFIAGIGLDQSGNTIFLDVDDLTVETIASADTIAFHDATSTPSGTDSGTRKTTAANFISDLNILTTGNITAQDGVRFVAGTSTFELDITNLGGTNVIVGADEMVFDDGASGNHIKRTVTNFLADLNIANRAYTSSGLMAHTADDTWDVVTIGASTNNDELGIVVNNGDGTANVEIGLDINGLSAITSLEDADEFVVVDDTGGSPVNRKVTLNNLATSIAGTTNLDDLADVNAASYTAGDMLVADGSDSYDQQKVQHIETVAAQTNVTVNHSLGQQYVIVQCYDTSGASPVMVIPQSVTLTDANNCAVVFSPSFSGKIVVMGVPGVV